MIWKLLWKTIFWAFDAFSPFLVPFESSGRWSSYCVCIFCFETKREWREVRVPSSPRAVLSSMHRAGDLHWKTCCRNKLKNQHELTPWSIIDRNICHFLVNWLKYFAFVALKFFHWKKKTFFYVHRRCCGMHEAANWHTKHVQKLTSACATVFRWVPFELASFHHSIRVVFHAPEHFYVIPTHFQILFYRREKKKQL